VSDCEVVVLQVANSDVV